MLTGDSHVKKHHTSSGKSKKASHHKYKDEKHSLQGQTGKVYSPICPFRSALADNNRLTQSASGGLDRTDGRCP